MRLSRIFAAVLMMFLAAGCHPGNAVEIGQQAPEFSLPDINGQTISLSDFKGKIVILGFFATWCPPCRQEVPDFIELQSSYGDKGFSVVAVALVGLEDAKDFSGKMGVNYPVLIDDGKVSEAYGPIRSIPTTFVLDRDGKIVKFYIGFRPKEAFEQDIKGLLK